MISRGRSFVDEGIGTMGKIVSSDTVLAFLGTLAAVLAVVINQQWLSDERDAITVMMDEYARNRHLMVQIEDTKREAIRLRDLNTLYSMFQDLATSEASGRMILEEAIRAYEIALISMAKFEPGEKFDATAFKIENMASVARGGDLKARAGMGQEFVRLFGIVDRRYNALVKHQREAEKTISVLRDAASRLSNMATYLQVFGLIMVMLATIIGLKRIEFFLK